MQNKVQGTNKTVYEKEKNISVGKLTNSSQLKPFKWCWSFFLSFTFLNESKSTNPWVLRNFETKTKREDKKTVNFI